MSDTHEAQYYRHEALYIVTPLFDPNDVGETEDLRDAVDILHMDAMLDIYRALPDDQFLREGLFQIMQDHLMEPGVKDDPRRTVLMVDALSSQDAKQNTCTHANMTIALIVLEEDWEGFNKYYNDLAKAKTAASAALVGQRAKLANADLPPVPDDVRVGVEKLLRRFSP